MTTSNYSESPLRSKELLKNAIAFIGTHQLSANPVNYTVCYEYLLGNQPVLRQAIDQAILEQAPLTDAKMERWFETLLTNYDTISLKQTQNDLSSILSRLAGSTDQAEQHVNQFAHTLQQSESEIADPHSSMENTVAYLLASTLCLQSAMAQMKQQIQQSRQEISSLQDRLVRTTEETLIDPLTGLTNRKGLSQAIETMMSSAVTSNAIHCLLMMDIDHFKKINDNHGHLVGDKAIQMIANTLKKQIKGKDTAARYGGEEFCVLLAETALKDAAHVAESIRRAVEKTRIKRSSDDQEICRMTISIGVTRFQIGESIADWFERADKGLYRSKAEGRNRVTCLVH